MKLQHTDTEIIVTELKPMSELPRKFNTPITVLRKSDLSWEFAFTDFPHLIKLKDGCWTSIDQFAGWLPMPVYRPEST